MRPAFSALLALHGLLHLLGVAKGWGLATLPQLTQVISPRHAAGWLAAAILFLAASVGLAVSARWWWLLAGAGVVVSSIVVAGAWADAKAGAVVNVIVLLAVAAAAAMQGPWSLRAEYLRDVRQAVARPRRPAIVTDADLAPLPPLVQRFLRVSGVVGRPRVWTMSARMHGRIRSGPDARWMPLTAEQRNVFDEPARFFYLVATMAGVPADGYHRFADAAATMRIKAAGLVPVQSASGEAMSLAETVTLFNDMCLLAPATLIDPAIRWETVDPNTVRASFTHAGRTIRADLIFDASGDLIDFRSDDRLRTDADGRTMTRTPWSTPVRAHRTFDGVRVMGRGEARWRGPDGDYAYIELEVDDVGYGER
jgi:hypothetical protein